ncbi:MAG: hypothetical protein AB7U73_11325 [Pirellulales bacterium]
MSAATRSEVQRGRGAKVAKPYEHLFAFDQLFLDQVFVDVRLLEVGKRITKFLQERVVYAVEAFADRALVTAQPHEGDKVALEAIRRVAVIRFAIKRAAEKLNKDMHSTPPRFEVLWTTFIARIIPPKWSVAK